MTLLFSAAAHAVLTALCAANKQRKQPNALNRRPLVTVEKLRTRQSPPPPPPCCNSGSYTVTRCAKFKHWAYDKSMTLDVQSVMLGVRVFFRRFKVRWVSVCNKCCSVTGADTRAQPARGRRYDCRVLLCTSLPATRADTHVNKLLQPLWLRMARRTCLLQQVIVCSLHVLYNTATGTRTEWKGNIPETPCIRAQRRSSQIADPAPGPSPLPALDPAPAMQRIL